MLLAQREKRVHEMFENQCTQFGWLVHVWEAGGVESCRWKDRQGPEKGLCGCREWVGEEQDEQAARRPVRRLSFSSRVRVTEGRINLVSRVGDDTSQHLPSTCCTPRSVLVYTLMTQSSCYCPRKEPPLFPFHRGGEWADECIFVLRPFTGLGGLRGAAVFGYRCMGRGRGWVQCRHQFAMPMGLGGEGSTWWLGLELRKQIWAGGSNLKVILKAKLIQGDCRLGWDRNSLLECPSPKGEAEQGLLRKGA